MANALILTYWNYSDALIQTYTLPYVRIIRRILPAEQKIFFLTLEKDRRTGRETIRRELRRQGLEWLPLDYAPYGPKTFLMWGVTIIRLLKLIRRQRISVLHCWCTPPGAIGYILSVLTGCRLILDSYEPHAEAMAENGTWARNGTAFRLLFWLEKKQTARANFIISATEGMKAYAREKYGIDIKNFLVKPACVDLALFDLNKVKKPSILKDLGLENRVVGLYAGKFGGIYLDREVFDFFAVAASYWGADFRVLLLTSTPDEVIRDYCRLSGLNPDIVVTRFVPHQQVPDHMGAADFAVTFVKPVPSKKYCTPIKDGEYWALGLPIVIPADISDDSRIVEENNVGAVLKEFNREAYFRAVQVMNRLIREPDIRTRVRKTAEKFRNYMIAEKVYQTVYGGELK